MEHVARSPEQRTDGAKPTVFIVEDDRDICRLIDLHLRAAGYRTECFSSGGAALRRSEEVIPSVFLLDIMLPGENGLQVCQRIRHNPKLASSCVIFVTARIGEDDRILGLETGGDDYITKPFSPRELVARVKATLRRAQVNRAQILRFGEVEVDFQGMILRVKGREEKTTTMEFRILEILARSPGTVFSRERLLHLAGSEADEMGRRSIDVYISRLRDKIELDPRNPEYITTVRGAGYRFDIGAP